MKIEDIRIKSWYWFHSYCHQCVVMGQAKTFLPDKAISDVEFWKVTNTDGSKTRWTPDDCTNIAAEDIIKLL